MRPWSACVLGGDLAGEGCPGMLRLRLPREEVCSGRVGKPLLLLFSLGGFPQQPHLRVPVLPCPLPAPLQCICQRSHPSMPLCSQASPEPVLSRHDGKGTPSTRRFVSCVQ